MKPESPDLVSRWARPAHQSRSRDQRDRLLKAGERVFAEQGFWQAHVAEIAARAGCSVGSFYRRFKDKETLFFALQAFMAERAEANIKAFFADPRCATEPMGELLRRLVANSSRNLRRIEGYFRALFELSLRGHPVWPSMRRLERVEADELVALLGRRGFATPPELTDRAHLALRIMHGQLISQFLHGPGPFESGDPRLTDELALLLERYLGIDERAGQS
jgi:AcrR family transcriptional regulator